MKINNFEVSIHSGIETPDAEGIEATDSRDQPADGEAQDIIPLIEREAGYVLRHTFKVFWGVLSPAGEKVALLFGRSGGIEGTMFVWDIKQDTLSNITGARSCHSPLLWSPQGDAIAAPLSDRRALYLLTLDGSAPVALGGGEVTEFAWSPDGGRIAYVDDNHIYVIHRDGSQRTCITNKRWEQPQNLIKNLVWWNNAGRDAIAFTSRGTFSERAAMQPVFLAPVDDSGVVQLTGDDGIYGNLRRDNDQGHLLTLRLIPEEGGKYLAKQIRIAQGTHQKLVLETGIGSRNDLRWMPTVFPNAGQLEVTIAGKLHILSGRRIEQFHFDQRLADARKIAGEVPLTLTPDPRTVEPQGPLERLPEKPLIEEKSPIGTRTVVATAALDARNISRTLTVGPVEVELLSVEVKVGDGVEVDIKVRYLDHVGRMYLDTARDLNAPFKLQEQYKAIPEQPWETTLSICGYYRTYLLAIRNITIDVRTGVWTTLTVDLLRHDEEDIIPGPDPFVY